MPRLLKLVALFAVLFISTANANWFSHVVHDVEHVVHDVVHDVDHVVTEISHDIEHVVSDVAKDIEHVAEEVGDAIYGVVSKVASALETLWHDAERLGEDIWNDIKTALTKLMALYQKFEADLLKVNEKIFGKKLGYILDMVENALIDATPVGKIIKIVSDGVEITKDVSAAEQCYKAHNWSCVSQSLTSAITEVGTVVTGNLDAASSLVKGIAEGVKAAVDVVTVTTAVEGDYKALKKAIESLKSKGFTVADAVSLVNQIGQSVDSLASVIESVLPAHWSSVAKFLQTAKADVDVVVRTVDDLDQVYVKGVRIDAMIKSMAGDFASKNYIQIGKDIAQLIEAVADAIMSTGQVASDLGIDSAGLDKVAKALTTDGQDVAKVAGVASAIQTDFKEFKQVFQLLESNPLTVAEVQQALSLLSQTLSSVSDDIATLDPLLHGTLLQGAKGLAHYASVAANAAQHADNVVISGQSIWAELQQAKADFKAGDWAAFGNDLSELCSKINALVPSDAVAVKNALTKAGHAVDVAEAFGVGIAGEMKSFKAALAKFHPPTVANVEAGLSQLASTMNAVAATIGTVSDAANLKGKWASTAAALAHDATVFAADISKADQVAVATQDVLAELQKASNDLRALNIEAFAEDLSTLSNTISQAIQAQTTDWKGFVSKLAGVSADATSVANAVAGAKDDLAQFQSIVKTFSDPCLANFDKGLSTLSSFFTHLSAEMSAYSVLASESDISASSMSVVAYYLKTAAKVSTDAAGDVTKVMVFSTSIEGDLTTLSKCSSFSSCVTPVRNLISSVKSAFMAHILNGQEFTARIASPYAVGADPDSSQFAVMRAEFDASRSATHTNTDPGVNVTLIVVGSLFITLLVAGAAVWSANMRRRRKSSSSSASADEGTPTIKAVSASDKKGGVFVPTDAVVDLA